MGAIERVLYLRKNACACLQSIIHIVDTVLLPEVANMNDPSSAVTLADGSSAAALASSFLVVALGVLMTLAAGML